MVHKKVLFRLERDDQGYPPVNVESVWAEETEGGRFVLDNIPFFARQATLGDTVDVEHVNDEIFYKSTHRPSGNSLLRVVFFDDHDSSAIRSQLADLGCSTEKSHLESLISVNVPPTVNIELVRALLDEGSKQGFWDYEEPILRQ